MFFEDKFLYIKTECCNCGYSWNYPKLDSFHTDIIQQLYFINVHICPHCHYVNDDITIKLNNIDKLLNSASYKKIIKEWSKWDASINLMSSLEYIALAMIKDYFGEHVKECKAYLMASDIEIELAKKDPYNFPSINPSMIKNASTNSVLYNAKALEAISKHYTDGTAVTDNDELLMCYTLIRNNKKDEAFSRLVALAKKRPTAEIISMVKALNNL